MPETLLTGLMLFSLKSQKDIEKSKLKAMEHETNPPAFVMVQDKVIRATIAEIERQIEAIEEYEKS